MKKPNFALSAIVGAQSAVRRGPVAPSSGGNDYNGPEFIQYQATNNVESRLIDMFFGDWHTSLPRCEHGSLVLRDILTHGDNYDPPQKGAVLQYLNWCAHATLAAHASTKPSILKGQQEVYYVYGGRGEVTAGGEVATVRKDTAIFMPAGLQFIIRNTGNEPLTAYLISEPTPFEFKPRTKMKVVDEAAAPLRTPRVPSPYTLPGASGHWAHIVKYLFSHKQDGLASLGDVLTVTINPLTMGEPHPHGFKHEEVWVALEGTSLAFIATQLRLQPPGMAYMLRPDGVENHANINFGDKPVKFLYFVNHGAPEFHPTQIPRYN